MVAHASTFVWDGCLLTAMLINETSPALQDSGLASAGHTQHGANSQWRRAPLLWLHQPELRSNRYGADARIHLENTESGASLWVTSHLALPGQQYLPVPSTVSYPVPSVRPMDPSQSVPGRPHTLQYAQYAPSHIFHTEDDGMPVNVRHGAVLTEARGVFIQNLSYQATSADVENLMRNVGRIVRCEVNTDTSTGRSKGSAAVKFTRAEDVTKAIDMFNGTLFRGRILAVRLDRNQEVNSDAEVLTGTSSGRNEQEPIIVDGSIGSV